MKEKKYTIQEFIDRLSKKFKNNITVEDVEDLKDWIDKMQLGEWDLYPLYNQIALTWDYKTFPTLKFIASAFYAVAPSFSKHVDLAGDNMTPEEIHRECVRILHIEEPENKDIDFRHKWDKMYSVYDLMMNAERFDHQELDAIKRLIIKGEEVRLEPYFARYGKFCKAPAYNRHEGTVTLKTALEDLF